MKFTTEGKNIDYVSIMDGNKETYTIAVGKRYTSFISEHYKFIENNKIEEATIFKSPNYSLDPFSYQFPKCGEGGFKTMEYNQIHSFYPYEKR